MDPGVRDPTSAHAGPDSFDETVRLQFSPVARYPAIGLQILGVCFDE